MIKRLELSKLKTGTDGKELDQSWRELWADLPIEVLQPDAMLAWMEGRAAVIASLDHKVELQRELDLNKQEEERGTSQVSTALTKVGLPDEEVAGKSLRVLIEIGEQYANEQKLIKEKTRDLRGKIEARNTDVDKQQRKLKKIESDWNQWNDDLEKRY